MGIIIVSSFVPFSSTAEPGVSDRLVRECERAGMRVAVNALPIDPDPDLLAEQRAWIRLMRMPTSVDTIVCLGAMAAHIRHPRKTVWLADGFDADFGVGADGIPCAVGLDDARLVACDPGHRQAARHGVLRLPVPRTEADWRPVPAVLAP